MYNTLTPGKTSIVMSHTAVTLAPPGNSPNTFRFSEALMVGSIPVVWKVDGWCAARLDPGPPPRPPASRRLVRSATRP